MNSIIIYESILYSDAQTLVSNNELTPNALYYITDKNVVLTAIDSNQFSSKGIYLYSSGKKAWGGFLLGGTSGNVSAITIGSDSLLTSTQTYAFTSQSARVNPGWTTAPSVDISLQTLATNIVNNINANSAINSKYKAYAIGKYVIIRAQTSGTTLNGNTINVTSSSITITSVTSMQGGTSDLATPILNECIYDFTNDKLLELYDPIYNNRVAFDLQASNLSDMFEFNWNNSAVRDTILVNCVIQHQFILSGSMIGNEFYSSDWYSNLIQVGNISHNIGRSAQLIGNTVTNSASGISGNHIVGMIDAYYQGTNKSDISYNICSGSGGGIEQNRLYAGGSIRYCNETSGAYGIRDNEIGFMTCIWNVSGWTACKSNQLRARFQIINLVATGYSIFGQNECTDDGVLNDINFSGGCYVIDNKFHGVGTIPYLPSTPVVQNWNKVSIEYSTFLSDYLDQNTLTNVYIFRFYGGAISHITLSGNSSAPIWITESGSNIGRFSIDVTIVFDGTNIGINGQNYTIATIYQPNSIIDTGFIYGHGLTGIGANISLGIATDSPTGILAATAITSINDTKVNLVPSPLPISTVLFRSLLMGISSATITAGTLTVHVEGFRRN